MDKTKSNQYGERYEWTPGESNVPGIPGVTVQKPTPTSIIQNDVMTPTINPYSVTNTQPKPTQTVQKPIVQKPVQQPLQQTIQTVQPMQQEQVVGTVFEPGYADDPYAEMGAYYKNQMNQEIDPQRLYQDKLNQWQGYMDSLRSVYADKYADVEKQVMGQLGTNRAMQARSGIIGSTFGGAQNTKVEQAGLEQKRMLQNEMDAKIQYLMGEIDRDVSQEIAAKREAIAQGAEAYTRFLAESQNRKLDQVNRIMGSAFQQGIENFEEIGQENIQEMSQKLGMPVQDLAYYFNTLKQQQIAEAQRALQEGAFNLSEGQARYDANGNLIASRAKTYAPSAGGGSGVSSQAQSWAELINSGRATIANVPSGIRSQVSQALAEIPVKSIVAPESIDSLLNNPGFDKAFGPLDKSLPKFGEAALARNQANQILAQLKLDNRKILKGQGAVSDWEGKTVGEAASTITLNLNEKIARRELENLKKTIQNVERDQFSMVDTEEPTETAQVYTVNGKDYQLGPDGTYYPVN